jgi:hypothetical protein
MKSIAAKQRKAIEEARQFLYSELDPAKINQQALIADLESAKNRLAAQAEIDPDLLRTRYETEARLRQMAAEAGQASDAVARQATAEALAEGGDTAAQAKQALIDAALGELNLGATLPPDVQSELVRAGLEKTGMTVGAATPEGIGGLMTRRVLGTGALELQQRRQQTAAALLGQAQNLESARAGILQNLFPALASTDAAKIATQGGLLQLSNQMLPSAGLSGGDIANLWLARVGASTSLAREGAEVGARGSLAATQAWQPAIGAASTFASNALPTFQSAVFGGGGGGGGGDAASWGNVQF